MDNPKRQFMEGVLPERKRFNKTALICAIAMLALPLIAVIVLVCAIKAFVSIGVLGVLVVIYLAVFIPWNAKVCKLEEKTQMEKFRKMVDGMVDQDEYDLVAMDFELPINHRQKLLGA